MVDCVEFPENPAKFLRPAGPPPGRFCGAGPRFRGIPTRSAEIRRNRHLLGATGCNFAPRGSVVVCVEFPGNPENSRGSRIRRPAGSAAQGRESANSHSIGRDSSKSPHTWGGRCNFAPHGAVVDCVEFPENHAKFLLAADPPPGRFCGAGARFRGIPTRSAAIRRNRHLLWATGCNFAPHGSVVGCVEFPDNPAKVLRVDDPPPGRFCGTEERFWAISTRSAEIRRNRHPLVATGCNFEPRGAMVDCVEFPDNPENFLRFADPPPGRFRGAGTGFREIPTRSAEIRRNRHILGATGALSHLVEQWSIV